MEGAFHASVPMRDPAYDMISTGELLTGRRDSLDRRRLRFRLRYDVQRNGADDCERDKHP